MKHLKLFMTLLMLVSVSVGFVSCSDDDDNKADGNSLLGTWQMVKSVYTENGTIERTINSTEDLEEDGFYVWLTVEKEMLYMSSNIETDKDDYEEPYTYKVNGDKLILTDANSKDHETWTLNYRFENSQLVLIDSYTEDGIKCEEYNYYVKR